MAFWFSGFFARPPVSRPETLPEGAVWRQISAPFAGVGVRLEHLSGKKPAPDRVEALARQLGIARATDWLYLTYVCWAGRVDSVYGLGVRGGRLFGPIVESAVRLARDAYLELMGEFGVGPADALRFPPFERGFWGEDKQSAARRAAAERPRQVSMSSGAGGATRMEMRERLSNRCEWNGNPAAAEEDIAALVAWSAVRLPAEYLDLLRQSDGGSATRTQYPSYVRFWPAHAAVEYRRDYEGSAVGSGAWLRSRNDGGPVFVAFDTRRGTRRTQCWRCRSPRWSSSRPR